MSKNNQQRPAATQDPVKAPVINHELQTQETHENVLEATETAPEQSEAVLEPVVEAPAPVQEEVIPTAPAVVLTPSPEVILNADNSSGVAGGLPPRALTLRAALENWAKEVSTEFTIESVNGGRAQYAFFLAVNNAIKDPDPISFMASMEVLTAFVKQHSGPRQVCNARYANRFAAHFAGGHDQRKAWEFLWVVLHAVTSDRPKDQMSEINWDHAFQHLADEYRVRLRQYFTERFGH